MVEWFDYYRLQSKPLHLESLDLELSLQLDNMVAEVVSCFVQSLPHSRAKEYCSHVPITITTVKENIQC